MKEQQNAPEKELNEREVSNLSDSLMIIRILISMKKDTKTIKKDQSEIKNAIPEISNILEGINSTLEEAEDRISVLKDKVEKNTQAEQQKEKENF